MKDPGTVLRFIRWLKVFVGLGLACLVFFLFVILEQGSRQAIAETGRPCVLLITVDSLRADLFDLYGGQFTAAKRINELMRQSAVFRAASSCTDDCQASLATLLTGHYPQSSGLDPRQRRARTLRPDIRTLAEVFKDQEYRTAAIVNAEALSPGCGLERGFDRYDFVGEDWLNPAHPTVPGRGADETTDDALEWIDRRVGQPFFLTVHYRDPAADTFSLGVYDAPDEWLGRLGVPPERTIGRGNIQGMRLLEAINQAGQRNPRAARQLGIKDARDIWRSYLASVAFTDNEIGRLLDGLRQRGLYDNCFVILTADHGEAFGEHNGFLHAGLHREIVNVPLSMKFPAGQSPWPGRRSFASGAMVQTVDIVPTLLEALSLPIDTAPQGISLMALMSQKRPPRSWCFYVGSDGALGMRDEKLKLLVRAEPAGQSFFNMLNDPRELNDLSAKMTREYPEIAAQYARNLQALDVTLSRGLPLAHRVADAR